MYLLYIDDSGSCNLKKDKKHEYSGGNSRFFVLGAILIQATELNRAEHIIDDLKDACFIKNSSEIKYSIKKNILNCVLSCDVDFANPLCYKKQVANLISDIDCTLFASIQDKYFTTSSNIVKSKSDIYQLSFETLLKAIDRYMYNNNISEPVICFIDKKDSGPSKDQMIYEAYKKSLKNKNIFKAFDNTIFSPTINVVYSQYTTGAQLADFVAGSIWSFYESFGEEKQQIIKTNNSIFKDKFYKVGDTYVGLAFCNKKIILE